MEERVWVPCGGLKLEARLWRGGRKAAVVCHPHPLYGGNMDNNVVRTIVQTFQGLDWTTLRFNFRGVGASGGDPGEGDLEVDDVRAALDFLMQGKEGAASGMVLAGYSFGAWVGLRALAQSEPLMGWVAIAPPVGIWDFSFARELPGRKLLLAGDRDEYCPAQAFRSLAESLPEPKEWNLLQGADHFCWGHEASLANRLREAVHGWPVPNGR
jgi:uncharacterized protein